MPLLLLPILQEILVTEKCKNIIKFGKDGNRHTLVDSSNYVFGDLLEITINSDANIYCTDEISSKLLT